jgi:hypothetical protein
LIPTYISLGINSTLIIILYLELLVKKIREMPHEYYLALIGSLLTAPNIAWQKGHINMMIDCPSTVVVVLSGKLKAVSHFGHFIKALLFGH